MTTEAIVYAACRDSAAPAMGTDSRGILLRGGRDQSDSVLRHQFQCIVAGRPRGEVIAALKRTTSAGHGRWRGCGRFGEDDAVVSQKPGVASSPDPDLSSLFWLDRLPTSC